MIFIGILICGLEWIFVIEVGFSSISVVRKVIVEDLGLGVFIKVR